MKETCVILAEGHPNMLEGIRGLLDAEFDSVVMVADRRSLMSAVKRVSPDLVVVDLSLPEADGVNIARLLKDENPDLRIIILSLYEDAEAVRAVMDAGAAGFVLKRAAGQDLPPAVTAAIEGRMYVSPAIEIADGETIKLKEETQCGNG